MELKELLQFIEFENDRACKSSRHIKDHERPFIRAVKLMEEIGELCKEILTHGNLQREEKQQNFNKNNIQEEFADVIIVTLMLAKTMNVDIAEALKSKIEKINRRYEND